eukprot:SAG31_NODE_1036_length_10221_cov_170.602326_9_plen_284_part_00
MKMMQNAAIVSGRHPVSSSTNSPSFTYEIRWTTDNSTSTIRPEEVASRLMPDVKLSDREAATGANTRYKLGQKVLACFSLAAADWAKAEIIGVIEHEPPQQKAAEDPETSAKAARAAARAAEEEAQAMAELAAATALEEEEIAVAEARKREHVMAMAKAAAIRRELANRGGSRDLKPNPAQSARFKAFREQGRQKSQYKTISAVRQKLPSAKKSEELLHLLANNQVVVISGETGCGKTTQCPQFILDEMIDADRGAECYIICTQVRLHGTEHCDVVQQSVLIT